MATVTKGLLAVVVGMLLGCTPAPKAPALSHDPIYVDSVHGFRLIAPDGWIQVSRANVPPGPVERERVLVSYHLPTSNELAVIEAQVIDLPTSTDLAKWLQSRPSHSVKKWFLKQPEESVTLDGKAARKFVLKSDGDGGIIKEVFALRGIGGAAERVTFFVGIYGAKEHKIRDQILQSLTQIRFSV